MSRSFWTIAQHISNIFASTDNRNICRGCRACDARARRLPQYLRLISVCKPHSASINSSSVTVNIVHRTLSQHISQSNHPLRPLRTLRQRPFSRSPPDTNLLGRDLTRSPYSLSTMIRSNLSPPPTFPATFWDLVPFLCAVGLALIFTVPPHPARWRRFERQECTWRRAAVAPGQLPTAVRRTDREGTRMVHSFALELLRLFSHPEEGHGLSTSGHCNLQV